MSSNNEPAFPIVGTHEQVLEIGITLRDYFAAKAMQACPMPQGHMHDLPAVYERIASHAYKMADAMLAERAKTNGSAA